MTNAEEFLVASVVFLYAWCMCAHATGVSIIASLTTKPSKFQLFIFWLTIYFIWPAILIRNLFDIARAKLPK